MSQCPQCQENPQTSGQWLRENQNTPEFLFKKCNGIMGVPISFLDKYCPEQFEVLGIANSARWIGFECFTIVEGSKIYNRIIIRKNKNKDIQSNEL